MEEPHQRGGGWEDLDDPRPAIELGVGVDEIVEVLAAHYLEAYTSSRTDNDAVDIRDSAQRMPVRAGQPRGVVLVGAAAITALAPHRRGRYVEASSYPKCSGS